MAAGSDRKCSLTSGVVRAGQAGSAVRRPGRPLVVRVTAPPGSGPTRVRVWPGPRLAVWPSRPAVSHAGPVAAPSQQRLARTSCKRDPDGSVSRRPSRLRKGGAGGREAAPGLGSWGAAPTWPAPPPGRAGRGGHVTLGADAAARPAANMALWGQPAVRALRLWGPGVHIICDGKGGYLGDIGGRRPIAFSAGVSGIFGNGGSSKKEKLSLQDVAELIRARACQRVVVMAGAGISTPSGIPDFRSPGSGYYSNLQQYDVPYPEAIFELSFFLYNPKPFLSLAKKLYPGNYRPNVTHYFLRLLHDKGQLLRLYTQNIDGLERASGIPASKLVEAHGSFASATCTVCRATAPGEDFWVEPFASLSEAVRSSVPRLLMNRDMVGSLAWCPRSRDVVQLGDLVHSVERLVELLGWTEDMQDLVQRETGKVPTAEQGPPRGCPPHCPRAW
ncbi:NAD-dependent protein deacetylase sirtuin-3, mitochondrial isoform 5-T5 [Hipposideros larvatus]